MARPPPQLTPKAAAADLAAFAAQLRQRIEAQVGGFDPAPHHIAQRRQQVHSDFGFGFFAQTYFPHYIRSPHHSRLHDYFFERLPAIVASPKGETDAIAAPRGEAKSTLVSQLFVLWCVVTGRKKYPVNWNSILGYSWIFLKYRGKAVYGNQAPS